MSIYALALNIIVRLCYHWICKLFWTYVLQILRFVLLCNC